MRSVMLTGAQFWDRESQSGWWGPNLKPYAVIGAGRGSIVGLALAGKASGVIPESDGAQAGLFPAEAGPTSRPLAFSQAGRDQLWDRL
jgi:hypothetical protein